jgi:hypothetical protein
MAGVCFSFARLDSVASSQKYSRLWNMGLRGLYGRSLLLLCTFRLGSQPTKDYSRFWDMPLRGLYGRSLLLLCTFRLGSQPTKDYSRFWDMPLRGLYGRSLLLLCTFKLGSQPKKNIPVLEYGVKGLIWPESASPLHI